MSLLATEPSSIGKVLDASIKLFGASFTKIIGFSLILGLVNAGSGVFTSFMMEGLGADDTTALLDNLPLFLVMIVVVVCISMICYSAVIYRLDNVVREQSDTYGEAFLVGLKKTPTMLLGAILYAIAVSLGLVLLIVPGIILMLSLFLYSFFIVVEEDKSAYQSLKDSHALVWKNWWRTLTIFTVPSILILIIYLALGLVMAYAGMGWGDGVWIEVFINLFSGLYMPFFYAVGYVQYHDLKLRKSGSDLAARMNDE